MSDKPSLKPCPFCGTEAHLMHEMPYDNECRMYFCVRCSNRECFCETVWKKTEHEAVKDWNKRSYKE